MKTNQLFPLEFQHNKLFIVDMNGEPYVPMRPIVEGVGLNWKTQHRKISDVQDRFCVRHMTTQIPGDDQQREMVCIPLRKVSGWLMSISPNKVKPELKDKLITYQNHCDEVLHIYWTARNTEKLSHLYQENIQLKEGLYAAHENWEIILEGKRQGLTHKQICQQQVTKPPAPSTATLKRCWAMG